jgi:hypothetical protein
MKISKILDDMRREETLKNAAYQKPLKKIFIEMQRKRK